MREQILNVVVGTSVRVVCWLAILTVVLGGGYLALGLLVWAVRSWL